MIKHGFIYLIAKLFTGGVGFLSIILYTRMLIPEEYGRYALILVYVNLINSLLYQWFRLGLIRYIPKYYKDERKYSSLLETVLFCYLACCFFTVILGIILVSAGLLSLIKMAIALFFLWTTAWFELSQAIQRSHLRPTRFTFMTGLKSILSLLLGILALRAGFGENGLLIGISLGTLLTNIIFIKEWAIKFSFSLEKDLLIQLVRYGMPLIISGGMAYIMQSIDRVMIGWLLGESEAGIYSVTFDFALQTVGMLMLIVNLSALPLVIRKLEIEGYDSAQNQLTQNYQMLLGVALPAVLGLSVLSSNVTNIVFGNDYREIASLILPIISLAMLFQGLKSYYTDNSYQLGKTTYKQAIPVVLGILTNVILNLLLIPRLELLGAAVSSLVSYLVSFVTNCFFAKRVFHLPFPVKETIKICSSSLVMVIALYMFRSYTGLVWLIVQIIGGVTLYSLLFLLLNIMNSRTIVLKKITIAKEKKFAKSNA